MDQHVIMLLFRLGIGLAFAAHGYQKFFKGGRIAGTAGWFDSMGMRPGRVHAVMAATLEVCTGLGIAAGFLTTFSAAGMIGLMTVAAVTVHLKNGFMSARNGFELNYIYAVAAAAIAGLGPGRYSLDRVLGISGDLDGYLGLGIAIVAGLAGGGALLAAFYRPPAES